MRAGQGDGGGLVVDVGPAVRGVGGEEQKQEEDEEEEGDEAAEQAQGGHGQDDGGDDEQRGLGVDGNAGTGEGGAEQPVYEADDLEYEAEDGDQDKGDEADDMVHEGHIVRPGRYRN